MFISLVIILRCTIDLSGATIQDIYFDWQPHVFQYINETFKPSQITLFFSNPNDEEFHFTNYALKSVMTSVSTMIVDTNSVKADDPIFQHSSFHNPRVANMFVIAYLSKNLVKSSDVSKVQNIIDLLVDIAPRPTRPRCLLIVVGSNKIPISIIESISLFAWSRKFIDFTTLVLLRTVKFSFLEYKVINQTMTYHYYNPFLDQHFSGYYTPDIEILPGKLKNFYGYKMIVAAINNPPYVVIERNETGYPILSNIVGSTYRILRILRTKMNFTFELAPSSFEYYTEGMNESLVYRLQTGEINFSMNHLFLNKASAYFDKLERSIITISEVYTALVPIILDKRVKTSKELFVYMIVAIGMFTIFFLLIYIMKFDRRIWSASMILKILLNVNTRQPIKWPERFIFFSITFTAFTFTINMLTELTEIQFEPYEDVATNNLTWMSKQGYTPAILEQFRDVALEDEILEDNAFNAKLQIFKNAEECAFRLNRGEKIVCFMTNNLAKSLIIADSQTNKEPKIKLLRPYLWYSWKTIVFEPGTPFVECFDDKLQMLRDVGLLRRFVNDVTVHKNKIKQKSKEEVVNTRIINTKWLISELLLGHTLGTLILLLEVVTNTIRKALLKFKNV